MGKKNKSNTPSEDYLSSLSHSTTSPIVDTHTHLASTFALYRGKYKEGKYDTVYDFVRGMYQGKNVEAIVDVWCEAPVQKLWKEFADSALTDEDRKTKWGGLEYWFVMGVHPHEARLYNDEIEADIIEAMAHPRCVGWGEMGLDFHYDNSPRDIQRDVFTRQLRQAVKLGKSLTIHTREADEDTERILKAEVPKDHKIHIHCFTDSPDFGQRLLDHFPNLYIGITGVVTFATNLDTPTLVRRMASPPSITSASAATSAQTPRLRILLETDAPFMVPSTIYRDSALSAKEGFKGRLPLSHTGMIPWTAEFVAGLTGEGEEGGGKWDVEAVMREARNNAREVYGV